MTACSEPSPISKICWRVDFLVPRTEVPTTISASPIPNFGSESDPSRSRSPRQVFRREPLQVWFALFLLAGNDPEIECLRPATAEDFAKSGAKKAVAQGGVGKTALVRHVQFSARNRRTVSIQDIKRRDRS